MNRTDLLSLADRLALRSDPDSRDACIALRKLAELRPVAWVGHGAITSQPFAAMDSEPRSDACKPWSPLYQLSEVLTHE